MGILKSRRFQGCIAGLYLLTAFIVAACDTVSVERREGVDDTPQYAGALHPAVITEYNATRFVAMMFATRPFLMSEFGSLSRSIDGGSDTPEIPGLGQIPNQITRNLRRMITPTIVDIGFRNASRARYSSDRIIPCTSGSIRIAGVLEDDGTGSFKIEYRYCTGVDTTFNGEIDLLVNEFDWENLVLTNGYYTISNLTLSGTDFSLSLYGTVKSTVNVSSNMEQLTVERFLTINNLNNEMAMLKNFVNTLAFQNVPVRPPWTEMPSGQLFASTYGLIYITTIRPLTYGSTISIFPDSGEVLFLGGGSSCRLSMLPFQRVQLEIDLDGDNFFEISTVLHWSAVLLGVELVDTDGDAMHDRWEIIHGFDPLNASDAMEDADNDGYSNVNEYLGGSNPHLSISVP